ncbi:MAG: DeoR/GlpR family DNA-binding transcription regulator [Betaproteobacteria bacterium]
MLIEKRRQVILDRLVRDGAVGIAALASALGVSRETVRRDLNAMAGRQLLKKTHGGALAQRSAEPSLTTRKDVNTAGKRRIGAAAARLVPDGASLIIDCGSTTQALAQSLLAHRRLIIYTNDLTVARTLSRRNGNVVHLLGGQLLEHEDATTGWETATQVSQYHVDIAFVGVGGIADDGTITDYQRDGAELRSRMLAAARLPVLLADRTKFGATKPVTVGNLDKVRRLITDLAPAAGVRQKLSGLGIKVVVAR